jgi:hypothetical protein
MFYLSNGEHLARQFSCVMLRKYAGVEDSPGGHKALLYCGREWG